MYSPEELRLLEKLASGALDGGVGEERVYRIYFSVRYGKQIRDGIPISYRQRIPSGKDSEPAGNPDFPERKEEIFGTDEKKLEFLQRYGWLMEDRDVRIYSAGYKPVRRKK